jgi:hypothetical protein
VSHAKWDRPRTRVDASDRAFRPVGQTVGHAWDRCEKPKGGADLCPKSMWDRNAVIYRVESASRAIIR